MRWLAEVTFEVQSTMTTSEVFVQCVRMAALQLYIFIVASYPPVVTFITPLAYRRLGLL